MSNRGYSGYYKGYYLRSSYEYIYAKILDFDGVNWSYEVETFDLGFKLYKPDFFLYNDSGDLSHIIEVKSEIKNEQDVALQSLEKLSKRLNINTKMVVYKDLSKMCKDRGLKITHLMNEWKNSENTTLSKAFNGSKNPHYNMKHSKETKRAIGLRTKERWKKDRDVYIKASIKGAKRAKELFTGEERKNRKYFTCLYCGSKFREIETSKKNYCSIQCSSIINGLKGANKVKSDAKAIRDEIKDHIHMWSLENKELVLNTPYNKITNLNELFNQIEDIFGIKDLRIISKSIFGEDKGRKELLRYLKKYVEA